MCFLVVRQKGDNMLLYVIELLKQGKSIREIAEEVHMSFGYDWKKHSLNCALFIYDLFHVESLLYKSLNRIYYRMERKIRDNTT